MSDKERWLPNLVERLQRHNPGMSREEAERIAREVLSDPHYIISER